MCFFEFYLLITPEYFPNKSYFTIFILQLFIFLSNFSYSPNHMCNKVYVIPNLMYFIAIFFVLHTCSMILFSNLFPFAVMARHTSIIFLQTAIAAFAFCFSMHIFIISLLNGFSYTPFCHFHSLCVLVPPASLLVLYTLSLYRLVFLEGHLFPICIKFIYPKATSISLQNRIHSICASS